MSQCKAQQGLITKSVSESLLQCLQICHDKNRSVLVGRRRGHLRFLGGCIRLVFGGAIGALLLG